MVRDSSPLKAIGLFANKLGLNNGGNLTER